MTQKQKKSNGVRHYHITRFLCVVMVSLVATTGLILGAYIQAPSAHAEAGIDPFIPYDATVVSPYVPTLIPGCPYYVLMVNNFVNPENPYPTFGLFLPPGGEADTYNWESLDIPTSRHIGGYLPVPCGFTVTGMPIFTSFFDGFFFLDGGSLGPDYDF